jgi:protein phosphatase
LLAVRSHGRTDKGRVRASNEDQFLIATLTRTLQVQTSLPQDTLQCSPPQGHLLAVADGVGGSNAGEQASALALSAIEGFVLDTLNWCAHLRSEAGPRNGEQVLAEFQKALKRADERVYSESQLRPECRGMGTTLTLAFVLEDELFVAHVGDSRCYLLRSGLLYRLTRDHTLVAEMVRRRLLEPGEAARHKLRHVVTNVVGGSDPGVQVEVRKLPLEAGDRLLLCSDGLTEMVSEDEVLALLGGAADPAAACDHLVERANDNGGRDNVTVVVASFGG